MALQFQTVTLTNTVNNNVSVTFPNTVNTANAAIQSFSLSFGSDTDQYVDNVFVNITSIQVNGNQVSFNVNANLQSEDNTTQSVETSITVLVIADVQVG